MAGYEDLDIQVSRLRLDSNNPRHRFLGSQIEIIEWMTSGKGKIGKKLLVLAKDILNYGLNPAEKTMAIQDEQNKGEYIVIEGNRRITALKLLNNPDIAPTKAWKSRFSKIRPAKFSQIKYAPCTIFEDPADAYHFIELKHMGESGGAGVVRWDAEQKARHDQRSRGRSRHHKALAVLDFIRNTDGVEKNVKDYAGEGFPITTLDRMLSDKDFRDFLGLGLDDEREITFKIDPREALKPLSKVITDFGSGQEKVDRVINWTKREEYKSTFRGESLADHSKKLQTPLPVKSTPGIVAMWPGDAGQAPRKYADPSDRRFIVIPGTSLPIDPRRFNRAKRVFEELKRVPQRDKDGKPQFPNAGILLIRLFLEMSVDIFILEHRLTHPSPTGWKDISLTERTRAVLKKLNQLSALNAQEEKVINKVLSDPHKIANPNSLNDFAHNINQIPNPSDLIDVWDTYTKFFVALWENIK